jgi:hypothetical protein
MSFLTRKMKKNGSRPGSTALGRIFSFFPFPFFPVQALILASLLPVSAFADGGAVLSQQTSGPWRVTLFGSPSPLRAGPTDLSVMIQDAKTGEPVMDKTVAIKVRATVNPTSEAWIPPCCSMKGSGEAVPATHANAQNKLLYAANLVLPSSGAHDVIVNIGGADGEFLESKIDVQPPPAPLSAYWTYLALPPMFVGIFALNQRLRRRSS